MRSRRWAPWLIIPFWLFYILACLALPLGAGFLIRASFNNEPPRLGLVGGSGDAWLGIRMRPLTQEAMQAFGLKDTNGVLVDRVYPTSPAEGAGLAVFDVIIAINGRQVTSVDAASAAFQPLRPGDTVRLDILRPANSGPTAQTLNIQAGTRPKVGEVRSLASFRQTGVPYAFSYPDTWYIDDFGVPEQPMVLEPPSGRNDFVQIQVASGVPALEEFYKQVIDSARGGAAQVTLGEEKQVTIAGQPARRTTLMIDDQTSGSVQINVAVLEDSRGVGYIIFLSCDPENYDKLLPNFDAILQSFSLVR